MSEYPKYLTREGFEALEQELHQLRTVKRIEIAASLHNIVDEGGDLLENTAYMEAKTEQSWLESRISYLEDVLAVVEIIEDTITDFPTDVVHLNSIVRVREEGCPPETYHIVGTAEANPLEGKLSDVSPLGRALLGKRTGEAVLVHTPDRDTTFRILDVH